MCVLCSLVFKLMLDRFSHSSSSEFDTTGDEGPGPRSDEYSCEAVQARQESIFWDVRGVLLTNDTVDFRLQYRPGVDFPRLAHPTFDGGVCDQRRVHALFY